jgi:ADP-glucose pyrophosphorylase
MQQPMKKYHYIIISITFVIYGFVYYQKYYAGPDVIDFYRDKGKSFNNFIENPDNYIMKKSLIYAFLNNHNDGIGDHDYGEELFIYFKKNKAIIQLDCISDKIEINGILQRGIKENKNYFYYTNIESIYGYDDGKSNPIDKGKKVKCYPN